jgi:hypothetical protein
MAATIIRSMGGMLGLVAVLLVLATGLAAALLAAIRRNTSTAGGTTAPPAPGRPPLARGERPH